MTRLILVCLLITTAAARSEEAALEYRELQGCPKSDETVWRAAKIKASTSPVRTVIEVDALFNCGKGPKNPSVAYSPVSTTLSVEEGGLFNAMCLCRHVMQFTLPRQLERNTTIYFTVEGKVYGHARVR